MEYRRELEAALPDDWRAVLPPNPTPREELEAWEQDAAMLIEAGKIVAAQRELKTLVEGY